MSHHHTHAKFTLVQLIDKIYRQNILLYPPEASGGYFGLVFATPPPRVERFSALTLQEENNSS